MYVLYVFCKIVDYYYSYDCDFKFLLVTSINFTVTKQIHVNIGSITDTSPAGR